VPVVEVTALLTEAKEFAAADASVDGATEPVTGASAFVTGVVASVAVVASGLGAAVAGGRALGAAVTWDADWPAVLAEPVAVGGTGTGACVTAATAATAGAVAVVVPAGGLVTEVTTDATVPVTGAVTEPVTEAVAGLACAVIVVTGDAGPVSAEMADVIPRDAGGSSVVAACACLEKSSRSKKIPAARISTCAARRATRREISCDIDGSHAPGNWTARLTSGRQESPGPAARGVADGVICPATTVHHRS
jgi:hypothetical protein